MPEVEELLQLDQLEYLQTGKAELSLQLYLPEEIVELKLYLDDQQIPLQDHLDQQKEPVLVEVLKILEWEQPHLQVEAENLRLSLIQVDNLELLRHHDKVQERLATLETMKPELQRRLADSLRPDRFQRELKVLLNLEPSLPLRKGQHSQEHNLLQHNVLLNREQSLHLLDHSLLQLKALLPDLHNLELSHLLVDRHRR